MQGVILSIPEPDVSFFPSSHFRAAKGVPRNPNLTLLQLLGFSYWVTMILEC